MVTAAVLVALTWLMVIPPADAKTRHKGRAEAASETAAQPQGGVTAVQVPMPQPRPPEAPARKLAADGKVTPPESTKDSSKAVESGNGETGKEIGKDEAAAPPPPSACRLSLTDEIAVAPSVPAIHGPGACGGDDLVRLEAVVLPDKRRVALAPTAIMRCQMATAVVNWVRSDIAPLTQGLGSPLAALDNFDSYECRGRNGISGAPLSEHGHANAIDVHGFRLADGRMIELTDRTQPRELRENVLHSACTRFTTVLGPDSDGYHEDHIHIDLLQRHNDYRICQWDVLDPLPKVAPLLPAARPDDAPPREIVEAEEGDKKDHAESKGGNTAKAVEPPPGKGAPHPAGPDDAKKEQATSSGKAAAEKAAQNDPVKDNGAKDKQPPGKAATDKMPSEPASPAKSAAKSSPDTTTTDKTSNEKVSIDKTSSDKASADKSSADKAATDKASKTSASAGKTVAHKPLPRRRRHSRRDWNPFGAFF